MTSIFSWNRSSNHSHNKLNGKQQLLWSCFAFNMRNMGQNTATKSLSAHKTVENSHILKSPYNALQAQYWINAHHVCQWIAFSSPEPTIFLACGRDRELWPDLIFWACTEYLFRILWHEFKDFCYIILPFQFITESRPLKSIACEKWCTHDAFLVQWPVNKVEKAPIRFLVS